ncbi:MAG TPA: histidine phosphatase family protein [Ktedonobacterales bacterium]
MRKLMLVRHAASEQQPNVPAREWALSPTRQADAERLADLLAPYASAAILASDEPKAQQTAQPLADRLGLPVEIMAGLHEHERRTASYMGHEMFQATMARFFAEPDTLVFGEETARQALVRFTKAVESALATHPYGDIAIFTHGTVLSLFVASQSTTDNPVDPMNFWWHLNLPAWVVFSVPGFTLLEARMRLPERSGDQGGA